MSSRQTGAESRSSRVRVTRNTAIRTPTARAALGNSLGRCGWGGPPHGRCSKTPPRHTGTLPASECQAQNGFVVNAPSGRKLAYGDLAKLAATMPVPPSSQVRLKDRKDWRYIGKPRPIVDLKDIVQGRATYGIDVVLPGMKYASGGRG